MDTRRLAPGHSASSARATGSLGDSAYRAGGGGCGEARRRLRRYHMGNSVRSIKISQSPEKLRSIVASSQLLEPPRSGVAIGSASRCLFEGEAR